MLNEGFRPSVGTCPGIPTIVLCVRLLSYEIFKSSQNVNISGSCQLGNDTQRKAMHLLVVLPSSEVQSSCFVPQRWQLIDWLLRFPGLFGMEEPFNTLHCYSSTPECPSDTKL